jgi:Mg-chelatase subunit ChlD
VAQALIDAYRQLEEECVPIEEKRREYLDKERVNTILTRRHKLDPLRWLEASVLKRALQLEHPEALGLLVERALLDDKLPTALRVALIERITALEQPPGEAVQRALRTKNSPATLLVGLKATELLGRDGREIGGRALDLLRHSDPGVRRAAVRALVRLALRESLVPMIDALEKDLSPRGRQLIADSLQVLTRQKIGAAPDAWRRWLENEGAPYVAGEVELGGGESTGEAVEAAVGRYHTLPLDGESIIFVIDRSGSMDWSMSGNRRAREFGEETREERAKTELIAALGTLSPRMTFNVIAFDGSPERFAPKMKPATPKNLEDAQEWVRDLDLGGATGIYDALDLAFFIAGRDEEDRYWPNEVDTVFLLTDGEPMFGGGRGRGGGGRGGGRERDDTGRIRDAVRRWNALGRVVVNTIGLGDDIPVDFLRGLAEENGGHFVHERARPER